MWKLLTPKWMAVGISRKKMIVVLMLGGVLLLQHLSCPDRDNQINQPMDELYHG